MKFSIPAEEAIKSFELIFLLVFFAGMLSFTTWIVFQYPQVGITLMGMGVLLLWLAKMIRKKRDNVSGTMASIPNMGE